MEWLNYHHLRYFWTAAREGSISAAAGKLLLAQPTVSAQIRALERALETELFNRAGRRLTLTETGETVFAYAEQIFALGEELADTLRQRPTAGPLRLRVGVAEALHKLVACSLLEPALRLATPVQLACTEDTTERLVARLSLFALDVVLCDAPVGGDVRVRTFTHELGDCAVMFFGTPALARAHRDGFPGSLAGAPMLLPTATTTLRRALEAWFNDEGIRPLVVGEFEDSAMAKAFGQRGAGLFTAPSLIAEDIVRQYGVEPVGSIEAVRERFYAISIERKLRNPAVVAICEQARGQLGKPGGKET